MTLDDAIKHCYERAEELREKDGCLECAHEHEELAGWLEELKKWRANDRPKGKWIVNASDSFTEPPYFCSECNGANNWKAPFCEHCGAEMEEDEK